MCFIRRRWLYIRGKIEEQKVGNSIKFPEPIENAQPLVCVGDAYRLVNINAGRVPKYMSDDHRIYKSIWIACRQTIFHGDYRTSRLDLPCVYSTICLYTYSHPLSFTSFLNLEQSGWSQSRLAGNVKKGKLLFPDTVYTVALAAYKEGTVNTEIERECEHKRDPRCRTNIDK